MVMILLALMGLTSCQQSNRLLNQKPHLELTNETPYQLTISDFNWGYGMTAINQFNGDFGELDKRVFDLLKGKEGICKVYVEDNSKDKHGNAGHESTYFGDLDLSELNRYSDWEYWHKEAGMRKLFYDHFNPPNNLDSTTTVIP